MGGRPGDEAGDQEKRDFMNRRARRSRETKFSPELLALL
jgi:hypothetical protein